jgi:preprotein translocase subunit SecA
MLKKFVNVFGGDPNQKRISELAEMATEINALEPVFEKLSDAELRAKTDEFRAKIQGAVDGLELGSEAYIEAEQAVLDELLFEAFAVVREASKRTLGMRHYDVQLIGGVTIHRGEVAEMKTGEGKTLVGTLPVYLNALTGRGVHLITVNDYLARRDPRWMGPIYDFLGLSVGILQSAATTDHGKKAFLYDPKKESTQEDQHQLQLVDRKLAYAADITYGTNSEFGFDYLRDNMAMKLERRVQRGHYFAIIDEVDNVLIDEARTPLIISGPSQGDMGDYTRMADVAKGLRSEDYEINERDRSIALTEIGIAHVEELLGEPLSDPDRPEDVTPEQARLMGYLEQALRAEYLFKRNKDYLVQGGKVVIVDEHTGRLMAGRRWSDGLHQAVEAKEGTKIEPENITYATVTLQNYFRMYNKLAGMTGTALTEAEEFDKIYNLEVLPIPTNLEHQAATPSYAIEARNAKEASTNYTYTYYVPEGAPEDFEPELWKRKDYPDSIFRTVEAKLRAIVKEAGHFYVLGRPQLIGTTSVAASDRLSGRLRAEPVRRLLQTLLIRHRWMEVNDRVEDGRAINELQPLYEPLEQITPAMLRQFAKPLEMSINPADEENLTILLDLLDLDESHIDRLKNLIQGGVPHNVLNARKHTEESQIIAGAGAFGAVTIATNMAGRGVDIKLGGDIAEEILSTVNRVLSRNKVENYFNMTLEEQRQVLLERDDLDYGIYDAEIRLFLQYFEEMEHVKAVGGLHVIGSERHDARRIDNQLRGRAGRQGDPGSSRFFLSLEDDLMRLFGGDQVGNLMQRLNVDDTLPLENKIVSNIIESSQQRVEGANFDVREHLLDYDNVLNSQRERIYAQRDRVFTKEDLSEDVNDMLRTEVENRVHVALADEEEGPWRLLAWTEGVQPSFTDRNDELFPSFGMKLILDEMDADAEPQAAIMSLLRETIDAEQGHLFKAIESLVYRTGDNFENQLEERFDALDMYIQTRADVEEVQRPQEMQNELNSLIHLPLKLSNNELRILADDPYEFEDELREKIESLLKKTIFTRLLGSIEYRLQQSLGLDIDQLLKLEWGEAEKEIVDAADQALEARLESLAGENGQLVRDLESALKREPVEVWNDTAKARLLLGLAQGVRTGFDRRTHKQVKQVYVRFQYSYLAAQTLDNREAEDLIEEVMDHFDTAQSALQDAWGEVKWREGLGTAATLADVEFATDILGDDFAQTAPVNLPDEERETLISELGHRRLNEIQRDLLLRAITDQWVEYLTKVEALRVSIGLEAYAQRDPLVQYRRQASEMFQQLMGDIRSQVVSRVFAYQPRRWNANPLGAVEAATTAPTPQGKAAQAGKPDKAKKKRRRRRKK